MDADLEPLMREWMGTLPTSPAIGKWDGATYITVTPDELRELVQRAYERGIRDEGARLR